MIALDTETTGIDLNHGAQPYLVTIAREDGTNCWWEWDVDPLTRKPLIVYEDLSEIQGEIERAELIAMQNPRFDVSALNSVFQGSLKWDWNKVRDCLLDGHLLASNQPHGLTTMVLVYCGLNIKPYENAVKSATEKARRICRNKQFTAQCGEWAIASRNRPDMPSAKGKVWKYDMWLPRTICRLAPDWLPDENGWDRNPKEHSWFTVVANYANADSTATMLLRRQQDKLIDERGLTAIHRERLKILPVVESMENTGIILNRRRMQELCEEYSVEAAKCHRVCVNLTGGAIDKLPVNGRSNALNDVIFNQFKLESPKRTSTGNPSMDREVLDYWLDELPPNSKARLFVKCLKDYRKRKTALSYMEGYERFALPYNERDHETGCAPDWCVLHPRLNPTGTDTLRFSSSNPNEQNISKQEGFNLRYCFGPAPGREWWSCDAENIELRLPAYESGEEELIALYENSDDPPYYGSVHLLNFSTVYPDIWDKELRAVGYDKVGPHCKKKYAATWYQWCKNGDFAVQYGAVLREGSVGTADRAFHREGSHARLKERFDKLEMLNNYCIDFAQEHGYVETIPDRTVDPNRGYPLLCSRNRWGSIKPTVPLNYRVQGSAMWWMMKAMVRCHGYLAQLNQKDKRGYHIIMQVHDELVFDFPKGKGPEPWRTNLPKMRHIQGLMRQGGDDFGIPTPVGCEYHEYTWDKGMVI